MRNALVDRLGGENRGAPYRLEVELDDDISGFGIRGDRSVTRERRTLRARYRLVEAATGQVLLAFVVGIALVATVGRLRWRARADADAGRPVARVRVE